MAFIDEITISKDFLSITVDEWGGKEIFFTPITLADSDYCDKWAKGKDGEWIVYFIIRKCLDESGEKLFTVKDKQRLMKNVDSELLAKIVMDMRGEKIDYEKK